VTPDFSVSIVARNESRTLPRRLLLSLSTFIDRGGDVVLVDTGSTDQTADVAHAHGCRVFEEGDRFVPAFTPELVGQINQKFVVAGEPPIVTSESRVFDFAAARNYADSLCRNDVVLVAGADEMFTCLDIDTLNILIATGKSRMDIHYVHAHDEAGRPRISFRRGVFYDRRRTKWRGVVHEVISSEGPVHLPPPEVITCEHFQEPNENRTSYLPGLALDCFQNPDSDRNSHYLARELHYTGRHRSALAEFFRHIGMAHAWDKERAQSMIFVGDCHLALGDDHQALHAWHEAFEMDGTRREPLMRLAGYHYRKANHARAAAYASAALVLPAQGFYFDLSENYQHLPHEILYVSLWWMGQKEESRRHWQQALAFAPESPKYQADAAFYRQLQISSP
jgi:glycosyltransferase involved in cell wall biosynthesis